MRKYVSTQELLRGMGEEVLQAAKAALEKGAEEVVAEAKSRCPVYKGKDRRVTPGALRDSIHAEKKKSGTFYRISAGRRRRTVRPTASSWSSVPRSTSRSFILRSMPGGTVFDAASWKR